MKKKFDRSDLRLLVLATFRYSLGRRTYMPDFIVDFIIKNKELLNKGDWNLFIQEIKESLSLGDSCDIGTWDKLIDFSKEMLSAKQKNHNYEKEHHRNMF